MAYWTEFSTDPSANTKVPPLGAPESGLPNGRISDTFRVVMAAIREVGNYATTIASALGTMAAQNSNSVSISGGTIGGTTQFVGTVATGAIVNADTITTGTLPLARLATSLTGKLADGLTSVGKQALYDLIYPVGRPLLWHNSTGPVWSGVTATWGAVSAGVDAVIVGAGTKTTVATGAGSTLIGDAATSASGGSHDHGGDTGTTELSAANLPGLSLTTASYALDAGGADAVPTAVSYTGDASDTHSHTISSHSGHTHTVTHATKRYAFVVIQRTA